MTDLLAIHLMSRHPDEAATALEEVDADELAELLTRVPDKPAIRVLQRLPPLTVAHSLEQLPDTRAAALLAGLPTAVAVPLLQLLEPARRHSILARLPLGINSALRLVQSFPEGSVGAVMDSRAFTLPADIRVEDALRRIRHNPLPPLHRIFVVDRDHRLVGSLAVQDLLPARAKERVERLMQHDVPVLSAKTRLAAVEHHPTWTRDTLVAVTDRRGLFLGVLHQQRMVDALRAQDDGAPAPGSRDTFLDLTDMLWSAAAALLFPSRDSGTATRTQSGEARDEH
ncbi:MAG: magnesium transporter [Oceanospirillaceae bacterium]|nr:magnesium transporter [Oceanospirillaceae bacterium]